MKRFFTIVFVTGLICAGPVAASPCDDLGPGAVMDPAYCKGSARALRISEAEQVRRLGIITALNRCNASVHTPQGKDACAIRYPFDW